MSDFLDQLVDATLLRIRDLVDAMYAQAARETRTIDTITAALGPRERTTKEQRGPTNEHERAVIDALWNAPLRDVAVTLLWELAARAKDGVIDCSTEAVLSAARSLDRRQLQRETGVHADDLRFVLQGMAEEFVSLARDLDRPVEIDRSSYRFKPAPAQARASVLKASSSS